LKRAVCHLAIASLINGCASAPVTFDERARTALDAVQIGEVTVAKDGWGIDDDLLREASVAASAAGGALGGLAFVPGGTCEGMICGVYALVQLTIASVAAIVGAAKGATSAAERNEALRAAQPIFETFSDVVHGLDAAEGLRAALLHGLTRNGFAVDDNGGADTIARRMGAQQQTSPPVLAIELAGVRFDEVRALGNVPQFSLGVLVRYAVVDAPTGSVHFEAFRQARRGPLPFEHWAADDAAQFRFALEELQTELADAVLDELFLVYRSDDPAAPATEFGRGYFLEPHYPPRIGRKFPLKNYEIGFGTAGAAVIRTRQPLLRWSSVPARGGKRIDDWPGDRVQAEDLRYDVRVYDGPSLIVAVDGLTAPHYQVRDPLEPCKTYFWTFRARFVLDGELRVTDWAGSYNGFEPWNSRYPLLGIRDRDEYSNSDFADRTGYYHRFHVGNAAGKACGY